MAFQQENLSVNRSFVACCSLLYLQLQPSYNLNIDRDGFGAYSPIVSIVNSNGLNTSLISDKLHPKEHILIRKYGGLIRPSRGGNADDKHVLEGSRVAS